MIRLLQKWVARAQGIVDSNPKLPPEVSVKLKDAIDRANTVGAFDIATIMAIISVIQTIIEIIKKMNTKAELAAV